MDLNYSQEETKFREEVQHWLKINLPEDIRQKVIGYQELSKEDYQRWHKIWLPRAGLCRIGRWSGAVQVGT